MGTHLVEMRKKRELESITEVYADNRLSRLKFTDPDQQLVNLLNKMLSYDYAQRPTAADLLSDPFML